MGRVPGHSALDLMAQAMDAALLSAGLERAAIDGVITLPVLTEDWMMPAGHVARGLGLSPRYLSTVDLAGAGGAAAVDQAARVIASGGADTVLCIAADALLSGLSRERAVGVMANAAAHPVAEQPAGPSVPALYALVAARHMYEYGTTAEQLAAVAVQMRRHAGLNPNAHMQAPLTLEQVGASRIIASPLRLLDCAPVSDGGAALLMMSAARARQLGLRAARVLGSGYGLSHVFLTDADDVLATGARQSGAAAFAAAGLDARDLDFACLYDCFTITLLLALEDLGLCPRGEAGPFVACGTIDRDGALPVNPGGGLLSGGHPGLPAGLLPVAEAARQILRQAGARQLPRADVALAHGSGGVVGMHCSLLLGSDDV